MIKNILTIAGSDCSGGAGIQADIKAICANGGYAMSVITAITAQNTQGVKQVTLLNKEIIAAQIHAIFADIQVDAIKIGMLGSAELTQTVADTLKNYELKNIVLDPVMVAKSGDRLLAEDAICALKEVLLPMVHVLTPNLPEAGELLGVAEATTRAEMCLQAQQFKQTVLLKGGHLHADSSPDLLWHNGQAHWFETERITTNNTHGTGCSLSSTLATKLAYTDDLPLACQQSKDYLSQAINHASKLQVGHGHGPVHHFHQYY